MKKCFNKSETLNKTHILCTANLYDIQIETVKYEANIQQTDPLKRGSIASSKALQYKKIN
jgi:hypothetical protein